MSLPIFKGYPHTTSVLVPDGSGSFSGIERVLDYHPTLKPLPDMTYASEFIDRDCDGIYIKWLNIYGGYNYWLFSSVFIENKKVSSKGSITNNWTVRAAAKSTVHNIGMKSVNSIRLSTKAIHEHMKEIIGLVESPEIYLYTEDGGHAKYNTQYCGWLKVQIRNGTYEVKNSKYSSQELKIEIELPERNVQSIV